MVDQARGFFRSVTQTEKLFMEIVCIFKKGE